MMVNSPLEIYGAVIGVQAYDAFFNILYSFGFVYLPLFFIAVSGIKTLLENPFGYKVALGRAYWQLIGWVLAMMLAVIPIFPLSVDSISYTPACSVGAVPSTYGNTGTSYDQTLGNQAFPDVDVPPLMAAFFEAFSGMTAGLIAALPCDIDVPGIQSTINTTQLSPQLAQSVGRFKTECFAKASSEMNNQNPNPTTYQTIENQYGGASDLGWVGSHVYQTLYYTNLYPANPVPGFPYNNFPYPYQSYNNQQANIPTPQWGFPTCEQWWSDPVYGLEGQLVKSVQQHQPMDPHLGSATILDQVATWIQKVDAGHNNVGSQVNSDDLITHSLLYGKASQSYAAFSNYVNDNGMNSGGNFIGGSSLTGRFGSGLQDIAASLADAGQEYSMMSAAMERVEIQHEIEIMQAVLLTIIISVGPMLMLAGNLRMGVIFTYFFLLGSIILIAYIEQLVHHLEMTIYMNTGMTDTLSSLGTQYPFVYNVFTALYEYAPFVYLAIMSWCGVAAGAGVQSMMSSNSAVGSSAGIGGKITSTVASAAKFL